MPCFKPLSGYRARVASPSGKRGIVFRKEEALGGSVELQVPCGQCVGCRLEKSRKWAMRCMHEASRYEDNSFITLTYSPENLPSDGNLSLDDWQRFAKRLRHYGRFRFFMAGEYGEEFGRPHYHACLFGLDFPDRVLYSERDGARLWTSRILADYWPYGFSTVGDVTFESAAYVARYVMKKVTGDRAESHYMRLNEETGELAPVVPEFVTMSRRPGIGRDWFEKYSSDVFPSDEVVVRGKLCKPPRYYDGLYEIRDPEGYDRIKHERAIRAKEAASENSGDYFEKDERTGYIKNRRGRLAVREICAERRVELLKRGMTE